MWRTWGSTSLRILERENYASQSSRVVCFKTRVESRCQDKLELTFAIDGKTKDLDILSDFGVTFTKLEIIIIFLLLLSWKSIINESLNLLLLRNKVKLGCIFWHDRLAIYCCCCFFYYLFPPIRLLIFWNLIHL